MKREHAYAAYNILVRPHISEKSVNHNEVNKYVFEVNPNANKQEIKRAIERVYGVHVEDINKMKVPSKTKRYRRISGSVARPSKAIVTLREGESIEVLQ